MEQELWWDEFKIVYLKKTGVHMVADGSVKKEILEQYYPVNKPQEAVILEMHNYGLFQVIEGFQVFPKSFMEEKAFGQKMVSKEAVSIRFDNGVLQLKSDGTWNWTEM